MVVGHRHTGRSGHRTTCSFLKATPLLARTQGLLQWTPSLTKHTQPWSCQRPCGNADVSQPRLFFLPFPHSPHLICLRQIMSISLTLCSELVCCFVLFPSTDCAAPCQYSGLNFTCEVLLQHLPWSWHWLCFAGWWLTGPRHDLVLQQWLQLWCLAAGNFSSWM